MGSETDRGTDDVGYDGDEDSQVGLGRSIRPGAPVPPTVLVADMGGGTLLLQGWRDGPAAYVCAADAGPLRHALAVAFGDGQS